MCPQQCVLVYQGLKDWAKTWEAEWGGKVFFSHGSTHSKGVMILVNPKVELKIEKVISDNNHLGTYHNFAV